MAKQQIFTNSIITENFENKELVSEIIKELKNQKNIGGRKFSNFGGFQSNTIYNKNIIEPIGKKCVELLVYHYKINAKKIYISDLWINENNEKDFNIAHLHENSHFSGVYYVDVPSQNGELVFLREDAVVLSNQNNYIFQDKDFIHHYNLKPIKNMLVLFSSHLRHVVLPHQDKNARVSVSFNIKLSNG